MLSKAISLLLVATCAIAGRLPEGTYRITNVQSHSTARVYNPGTQIFVSSTKEDPGPFQIVSLSIGSFFSKYATTICLKLQWDIKNAVDGGYTIQNVGLKDENAPNSFAAVQVSS